MKHRVVCLLVAVVWTATASSGFAQTGDFPCSGPADVCGFVRHFITTLNNRVWDDFRACLADDVTVLFDRPAPPERQDGRDAVEALFRRAFAVGGTPTVTLSPLKPQNALVQPMGDAAVVSFLLLDGNIVGRRTLVLRRGQSGWQIIHIHASSAPAASR